MESGPPPPIEITPLETPPEPKGANSVCLFGSDPLVKNAAAVQAEFDAVREGKEIEAIHRIRVASRRLRTAMQLFKECIPEKRNNSWTSQVRSLTQALGRARDIDVQFELLAGIFKNIPDVKFKPGIRRILLRIDQNRQKIQTEVVDTINKLQKSKVLGQISRRFQPLLEQRQSVDLHDSALYQLAFDWINRRLNELLTYEVYIRRPEYKKELHAMRIAAKRLRYTMEIFSELYADQLEKPLQAARKTQQLIGEIHDCDVWIDFLPTFYESEQKRIQKFYGHVRPLRYLLPGLEYFKANRQQERDRLYQQFLKNWRNWTQQETWINLRESILLAIPPNPPAPVLTDQNPNSNP